jgi:hypothetical protein
MENIEVRELLGDKGVDGRILLRSILNNQGMWQFQCPAAKDRHQWWVWVNKVRKILLSLRMENLPTSYALYIFEENAFNP